MSKLNYLATLIIMPVLALVTNGTLSDRANAANTIEVACDTNTSVPTITATFSSPKQSSTEKYQSSQTASILKFVPEYFSPQSALVNCQKTAKLLHGYYSRGEMNYLASDTINGKPVVCAVERRGVSCDSYSSEILFSLEQSVNPTKLLYDMLGNNFKGSQLPSSRTVSRIYTDLRPSWWPFKKLF